MDEFHDIRVERRDDRVAVITFCRSERLNAFTRLTSDEVQHAIQEAEADDEVLALVLTGTGRAFCAGADLGAYEPVGPEKESPLSRANQGRSGWMRRSFSLVEAIRSCRKPVIAAVNGVAVGMGMGIAMACDVRIASSDARFNTMFARRGLASDYGLAFLLREAVGRSRALELLWRTDFVSAADALTLGIVSRVAPMERLLDECWDFLGPVLAQPPLSVETAKALVNFGDAQDLSQYMLAEEALQSKLSRSSDSREGVRAFLEKREPRFHGR